MLRPELGAARAEPRSPDARMRQRSGRTGAAFAERAGTLADHVVDLERLGLVLDLHVREGGDLELVVERFVGVLRDDDLVRLRDRAEARAGVHRVADDGVLERLAGPDVA